MQIYIQFNFKSPHSLWQSQPYLKVQHSKSLLRQQNLINCKPWQSENQISNHIQQHRVYITILKQRKENIIWKYWAQVRPKTNIRNPKFCISMSDIKEPYTSLNSFLLCCKECCKTLLSLGLRPCIVLLERYPMALVSPTSWDLQGN